MWQNLPNDEWQEFFFQQANALHIEQIKFFIIKSLYQQLKPTNIITQLLQWKIRKTTWIELVFLSNKNTHNEPIKNNTTSLNEPSLCWSTLSAKIKQRSLLPGLLRFVYFVIFLFSKTVTKGSTKIWGGNFAENLKKKRERNSPGGSVAVHSLAVFGQNTLKERNQRFAQGCRETVKKKKKGGRNIKGEFVVVTGKCTAFSNDISHTVQDTHFRTKHHHSANLCWVLMGESRVYVLQR